MLLVLLPSNRILSKKGFSNRKNNEAKILKKIKKENKK